ncbi:TPA: RNA polymerase Rpb4 [Candidatus Bathyarchaeota archaeon]|nr:RNA polymerase Rpb4 [Candidatus Bathyarchaeota archaeon]
MVRKVLKVQPITVPQVRALLKAIGEENLDQFQRRTLDYAGKFSKISSKSAEKLLGELKEKAELDEEEAVQIVNCMPESIEELRVFLAGGRRIVEMSKLELILSLLDKYRESKD